MYRKTQSKYIQSPKAVTQSFEKIWIVLYVSMMIAFTLHILIFNFIIQIKELFDRSYIYSFLRTQIKQVLEVFFSFVLDFYLEIDYNTDYE